jgi:hypothetical protein
MLLDEKHRRIEPAEEVGPAVEPVENIDALRIAESHAGQFALMQKTPGFGPEQQNSGVCNSLRFHQFQASEKPLNGHCAAVSPPPFLLRVRRRRPSGRMRRGGYILSIIHTATGPSLFFAFSSGWRKNARLVVFFSFPKKGATARNPRISQSLTYF